MPQEFTEGMITQTLLCGDCLELMREIPDKSVDLILCDLPYGTTRNKWDSVIPFEPLWTQYLRILTEPGVVALTASQPFTAMCVMSQPKLFRHEWIWLKERAGNFANTVREPFKEHESVLIFSRGKWKYSPQLQPRTGSGQKKVGTIQLTPRRNGTNYNEHSARSGKPLTELRLPSSWQRFKTEKGLHPNQKPVPLMEYLIRTYSNEGDVVLDNCMGSGTTGLACQNTSRHFIGIEKDTEMFEKAKVRLTPKITIARQF